jgi:hypothetical protein
MMAHLTGGDAPILVYGPLEISKADFVLKMAAKKGCVRVIKFLVRAGLDLRTGERATQLRECAQVKESADIIELLRIEGIVNLSRTI